MLPTVYVPKTTSYNERKRQNYEEASVTEYFPTHDDDFLVVSHILLCYISIRFSPITFFATTGLYSWYHYLLHFPNFLCKLTVKFIPNKTD